MRFFFFLPCLSAFQAQRTAAAQEAAAAMASAWGRSATTGGAGGNASAMPLAAIQQQQQHSVAATRAQQQKLQRPMMAAATASRSGPMNIGQWAAARQKPVAATAPQQQRVSDLCARFVWYGIIQHALSWGSTVLSFRMVSYAVMVYYALLGSGLVKNRSLI